MIGPEMTYTMYFDKIMNKILENFKLKMASCKDEAAEAV